MQIKELEKRSALKILGIRLAAGFQNIWCFARQSVNGLWLRFRLSAATGW
jgi:hypothetical protein